MTSATPENHDPVNHPKHYTGHPSGVECIQITEHMGFNLGNATKYIWRCDLKLDAIEDLKKARWYVDREIEKREREAKAKKLLQGNPADSIYMKGRGTVIGTAHVEVVAGDEKATALSVSEAVQRSFNGGRS